MTTTYEFRVYDPATLPYDSGTDSFTFSSSFVGADDTFRVVVTDDDSYLDGDEYSDEVGEDANQSGVVYAPDGSVVASGLIYDEQYAQLSGSDGSTIYLDRIEIGGQLVGYSTSSPLTPGATYSVTYVQDVDNSLGSAGGADTRLTYSELIAQSPPCFAPGTPFLTKDGPKRVEEVVAGEQVRIASGEFKSVIWSGSTPAQPIEPSHKGIIVRPGSLGLMANARPLTVSMQHRIMVDDPLVQLLFGCPTVFVAAKHLVDLPGVTFAPQASVQHWCHIAFERHECLNVGGLVAESLLVSRKSLSNMPPARQRSLNTAFRSRPLHSGPSLPCLSASEAALLSNYLAPKVAA